MPRGLAGVHVATSNDWNFRPEDAELRPGRRFDLGGVQGPVLDGEEGIRLHDVGATRLLRRSLVLHDVGATRHFRRSLVPHDVGATRLLGRAPHDVRAARPIDRNLTLFDVGSTRRFVERWHEGESWSAL